MADLQVTIKYKFLPARLLFILMMASLPLWEFGAPILFGYIIGEILRHPTSIPFKTVLLVCPALIAVIVVGIALTACGEDNRIYLSKDGISFPLFMLPFLGFRRARNWSELQEATVATSTSMDGKERAVLYLIFKDARVKLDLACVAPTDVEQLLLSAELWGTECKRSQELINYQHRIQNQGKGDDQDKPGYTQMWEEELSRRFQATSFIPLEPNKTLRGGKLKIIRQLAFGGLSAIYLAQENNTDLVVIKEAVVPPGADPAVKAEAEKYLLREAQILSKLNHPRIARVMDHFTEDARHYLKLEYVNGQDLRQFVKQNGSVDESTAVEWGLQILDALATLHAHEPPIIHRDLTPENLVNNKEGIKLIDFGAANQFVGSATGTIVGKQAYMPPEQLRGKASIESDIYAWAGTMHFLLTGKDPLPLSIAHPKMEDPSISDELDSLIAKCSEFEPEDRHRTAKEVIDALVQMKPRLSTKKKQTVIAGGTEA